MQNVQEYQCPRCEQICLGKDSLLKHVGLRRNNKGFKSSVCVATTVFRREIDINMLKCIVYWGLKELDESKKNRTKLALHEFKPQYTVEELRQHLGREVREARCAEDIKRDLEGVWKSIYLFQNKALMLERELLASYKRPASTMVIPGPPPAPQLTDREATACTQVRSSKSESKKRRIPLNSQCHYKAVSHDDDDAETIQRSVRIAAKDRYAATFQTNIRCLQRSARHDDFVGSFVVPESEFA